LKLHYITLLIYNVAYIKKDHEMPNVITITTWKALKREAGDRRTWQTQSICHKFSSQQILSIQFTNLTSLATQLA